MVFEWDELKARSNRAKHGLSFELAIRAFDDPFALYEYNSEDAGGPRFHIIGSVDGLVVVVVVFTVQERGANEIYRIISARKATSREREHYQEATD